MKRILLLTTMLATAACTSVKVSPVNLADPKSRVGIPYPLPFTQYRLQLTRQVSGCGPQLKVATVAKIEETRTARDPLHNYVIDPNSLSSVAKTSEIKAEYHPNGIVKTINAVAEDKTGEILANIGSIGVKIATLAAGAGGSSLTEVCKDEVLKALAAIETQRPKLAHASKNVETATAALKAAKEKIITMGASVDEVSKTNLSNAYDALTAAMEVQKAEAKALADLTKVVSHTETHEWPGNGNVGRGVFTFDSAVLSRWVTAIDDDPSAGGAKSLDFYAHIERATGTGRTLTTRDPAPASAGPAPTETVPETVDARLGIPFRQPDLGRLAICSQAFCDAGGDLLAEQRGNVLQLGSIYYLPCMSRAFSSISCSFEMTEDGWLKAIGTAEKQAVLAGGTASLASLIENATSIKKTLSGADLAAMKAETEKMKAEAEHRAAANALEELPNASAITETAALKTQIELAKARKDLLTAEAELKAVQALLAPGS